MLNAELSLIAEISMIIADRAVHGQCVEKALTEPHDRIQLVETVGRVGTLP